MGGGGLCVLGQIGIMHIRAIAHPNAYTLVPQPITQDMWHPTTNLVSDSPCCDLPLTVKKKSEVRVLSRSCDITYRFMGFYTFATFRFCSFFRFNIWIVGLFSYNMEVQFLSVIFESL